MVNVATVIADDEDIPFKRRPEHDFNILDAANNDNPLGLHSDGTTMWVSDINRENLFAYKHSDKMRDMSKEFNTLDAAGNDRPSESGLTARPCGWRTLKTKRYMPIGYPRAWWGGAWLHSQAPGR